MPTKKKKERCQYIDKDGNKCKIKLSLIDKTIICRCKKKFCQKHRLCESHDCEVDLSKIKEVNVEGGGQFKKIDKI